MNLLSQVYNTLIDLSSLIEAGERVTTRGSGERVIALDEYCSRAGALELSSSMIFFVAPSASKKLDSARVQAMATPVGPPPTMQTSGRKLFVENRRLLPLIFLKEALNMDD